MSWNTNWAERMALKTVTALDGERDSSAMPGLDRLTGMTHTGRQENFTIRSPSELRQIAEDLFVQQSVSNFKAPLPEDSQSLLHELQLHQIELELQNQFLRDAQQELANNLELFKDLYELAPVAYFTLDPVGRILKTNVLGRKLLGHALCAPSGLLFSTFVTADCVHVFREFLARMFSCVVLENCNLTLFGSGAGSDVNVRLEGVSDESGQTCRLVVTDISSLTKMEQKLMALEKRAGKIGTRLPD